MPRHLREHDQLLIPDLHRETPEDFLLNSTVPAFCQGRTRGRPERHVLCIFRRSSRIAGSQAQNMGQGQGQESIPPPHSTKSRTNLNQGNGLEHVCIGVDSD